MNVLEGNLRGACWTYGKCGTGQIFIADNNIKNRLIEKQISFVCIDTLFCILYVIACQCICWYCFFDQVVI